MPNEPQKPKMYQRTMSLPRLDSMPPTVQSDEAYSLLVVRVSSLETRLKALETLATSTSSNIDRIRVEYKTLSDEVGDARELIGKVMAAQADQARTSAAASAQTLMRLGDIEVTVGESKNAMATRRRQTFTLVSTIALTAFEVGRAYFASKP